MSTSIKPAIILCLLEAILQIITYIGYVFLKHRSIAQDKLMNNSYFNDSRNAWWHKEAAKITPVYHPFFAYIYRNIQTPYFNYDDSGARLTLYNPPARKAADKNIFFFGGSALAGYGVKDDETIPSCVADILNSSDAQYRITNYGQIGYNFNQELLFFISQLKNGNVPDVAVFYDGATDIITANKSEMNSLNDIAEQMQYAQRMGSLYSFFHLTFDNTSLIDIQTLRSFFKFLSVHIKLIHYPVRIIQIIKEYFKFDKPKKTYLNTRQRMVNIRLMVDNYKRNADMIEALSREFHFQYILLWEPLAPDKILTKQEQFDTMTKYIQLKPLMTTARAALKTLSLKHFFDLSNVFKNYADTSLFFDPYHVTPQGNRIIATEIARIINKEIHTL